MHSASLVLDLPDLDATQFLGLQLGEILFPGAVVALMGTLGAGKTHLVRAIALGAGVRDGRVVTSPTFVLIQEYQGRFPLYHFDVYRLRGEREFLDLGVQEYFESKGVSLIEWADRVTGCLPADHLEVRIEVTGEFSRRATLTGHGKGYSQLIAQLQCIKGLCTTQPS